MMRLVGTAVHDHVVANDSKVNLIFLIKIGCNNISRYVTLIHQILLSLFLRHLAKKMLLCFNQVIALGIATFGVLNHQNDLRTESVAKYRDQKVGLYIAYSAVVKLHKYWK